MEQGDDQNKVNDLCRATKSYRGYKVGLPGNIVTEDNPMLLGILCRAAR